MNENILEKYLYEKLNITIFQELDSTNNYAKQLGSKGIKENTLIIAESQTNGRGRMGRNFYSPNSTGLYFSLLLHPEFSAEKSLFLTVIASIAVAETIMEYTEKDVKIKWVNDVYIDGKKACGILTEGKVNSDKNLDYVVVGIGVNLVEPQNNFPDDIKNIATSVFQGNIEENTKYELLAKIVNRFFDIYNGKDTDYIKRYKEYSFLLGKEINIIQGNIIRPARVLDINDECHLVVENEIGKIEELSSSDVSVRIK